MTYSKWGIDWDGPLPPTDCSENTVYVDPPERPLTDTDFQELCARINPLDSSSEYGLELYVETLQFVLDQLSGYRNLYASCLLYDP